MHPACNKCHIEFLIELNQNSGKKTNMTSSIFVTQHCGLNSCECNDSVDNTAVRDVRFTKISSENELLQQKHLPSNIDLP